MSDQLHLEDIDSYNRELREDESGTRELPILISVVKRTAVCWKSSKLRAVCPKSSQHCDEQREWVGEFVVELKASIWQSLTR